jgi:protein-S-isoprenylcysteine O-methyltransferase
LVRHPGYSGSLLIWVGYALGLGNWIAAALTFAVLGAVYLWRVNAEESLLVDSLGPQYADYQRHTKRLVPYLY